MFMRLAPLLLFACAVPAWGAAPALAVTVEHIDDPDGGKVYRISSSGTVAASPATVWRILTDYDSMPEYVPDLRSARVVSRDGARVIVEQQGGVRFLFFNRAIHLVVQVQEQAPDHIDVSLVNGDMKVYRASWALKPASGGGTRVDYRATIAPNFYVPALVGTSIVRKDITSMMAAVLQRLDRPD
jgi:ribosome-associated toxin RatA of RatAB toxin-antitoxin module